MNIEDLADMPMQMQMQMQMPMQRAMCIHLTTGTGVGPTPLATLGAMCRGRDVDYGPVHTAIASRVCETQPVCALVVAVYACEPW